jgi:hypothetical protein
MEPTGHAAETTEPPARLGLTDEEIGIWRDLGDVAGRMLRLPVLHPMEEHETAHDFHKLQLRLLARPGLRALGWPGPQGHANGEGRG